MSPVPTIAFADTSGVLGLHRIRLLDLLRRHYPGGVVIPEAVRDELERHRRAGKPDVPELADYPWLQVKATRPGVGYVGGVPLGDGEVGVLTEALAHFPRSEVVALLDDDAARREAQRLEIQTTGVVGLLVVWKEKGWIPEVRPMLDLLKAKKFHVGKPLRAWALKRAGESEDSER